MRDKLIELLKGNIEVRVSLEGEPEIEVNYEECADILLKNGVTVRETAKWIKVFETNTWSRFVTTLKEECTACGWHVYRDENKPQYEYCPSCGRKMVLPKPPKEG